MTAEMKKKEQCTRRVKSLAEEERSLREEMKINSQTMKDNKASIKLNNDELKFKHANAINSLRKIHISKVNSIESS